MSCSGSGERGENKETRAVQSEATVMNSVTQGSFIPCLDFFSLVFDLFRATATQKVENKGETKEDSLTRILLSLSIRTSVPHLSLYIHKLLLPVSNITYAKKDSQTSTGEKEKEKKLTARVSCSPLCSLAFALVPVSCLLFPPLSYPKAL